MAHDSSILLKSIHAVVRWGWRMHRRVMAMGLGGLLLMSCKAAPELSPPPRVVVAPSPSAIAEPPVPVSAAAEVAESGLAPTPTPAPIEIEPEPEPEPLFVGQDSVQLHELVAQLEIVAEQMADSEDVRADYDALVAAHGLRDDEALYRDYVRVKLAFEATRDGGYWHLRWDITNEKPNSEQIWKQWRKAEPSADEPRPTAVAECDELSALFAFIARKLGVRHIGLYWPQWNHVVAVWTVQSEDDSPVRIVVPTSQIFLTNEDSLGTTGFNPWSQKTIYEYRRRDVKDSHRIDAELARFFVQQARRFGGRSQLELQRLRNERDLSFQAG